MTTGKENFKVVKAERADLECVLSWLRSEYEQDGEGFWINDNVICEAFDEGKMWVIRNSGQAVAFHASCCFGSIICVRQDMQCRGYGTALAKAWIECARKDGINVLKDECMPRTSLPFWLKFGFKQYHNPREPERFFVRLIIERDLEVPADLPRCDVTVSVYPEAVNYEQNVEPIVVHRVRGAMHEDGTVSLERRIIAPRQDEPKLKDLVIKIEVDGKERCFCKAKYIEARQAGVQMDQHHQFFIDAVPPTTEELDGNCGLPTNQTRELAIGAGSAAADT